MARKTTKIPSTSVNKSAALNSSQAFSREAQRFGDAANQLALASSITINHRMPQFLGAAMGLPAAQEEVRHAVIEKMSAAMEAQMATGFAMMQLGWSMMSGGSSLANMALAADVAHAAMEPASRRAQANATRLSNENA